MVMAEAEQPTTAQATADAPATEPTTLAAAADADKAAEGQQAQTTREQEPEWKARVDALEKAVADKDARLRGQDKAINKLVRRLDDLKAGTPEAKALRLELEAMREDAANQVDTADPTSATAKAKAQGKALLEQAAKAEAEVTVQEEEADFMQRIAPRLKKLGYEPDEQLVYKVDDDLRPISRAIRSGNFDLAETRLKVLELERNMTAQPAKPAPKTYSEEEFQKAVAAEVAKQGQKANKSNLRESGLIETTAATGTSGVPRLTRSGAEEHVLSAIAAGDVKTAKKRASEVLDQFYKNK